MGRVSSRKQQGRRHDPLMTELDSHQGHFKEASKSKSRQNDDDDEDDENAPEYIDARQSRKILQLAKEQQQELEEDQQDKEEQLSSISRFRVRGDDDDEEEEEDDEDNEINPSVQNDEDEYEEGEYAEEEEEEVIEIDEEDAAMFDTYFKPSSEFNSANGAYNLADKIMAAIREKEMGLDKPVETDEGIEQQDSRQEGVALPPKLIQAYTTIGTILSTWTHGKLPKLFKIIPTLRNWQDVLYVTNPEKWTPHVIYEATKLFVSNLGSRESAKFINMVLLPRFQEEIEENEKHDVNYHIYRALKKSLYKPAAFFKGFLFPLVEYGCNVREAMIAGSVLQKVSIPVLHSSTALSWLVQQKFSPAATVFIRILLEKKYALPYQTVDECVFYFMRFRNQIDGREVHGGITVLPVAWHKAFLAFAQRYKNDITEDQKDFLLETLRQRNHPEISKEIRRELLAGKSREFVESNESQNNDLMLDI